MTNRVALYVRVSTEEQKRHGISVDNQIDALKEYALENNYTVVGLYNDAGISARKSYKKRPALLQLLEDCKAHKIDLILFTKLDRWFRSVADYYDVQRVLDDNNVKWRSIWEDYETETSSGVFKVNIMLSVAQSEADRTSERIKNTFEYKRSKGEYVGGNKAPLGYSRTGTKLVIKDSEKTAIQAFFNTYLNTFSQQEAIQACRNAGLSINPVIAQRILYHPAYYGGLNYCDEAYITKEQHELIEKAKKRHIKNFSKGYQYIFSGLCRCGLCGKSMSGARTVRQNKNGTTGHSIRYVCHNHEKGYGCAGSSINEKTLEAFMIANIADGLDNYNLSVSTTPKLNNEKQIKSLKSRLERLKNLYELGDIDFTEYKDKRTAINEEIAVLENTPYEAFKELPSNWLDIYNELDVKHKRAFWSRLVNYIEVNGMRCSTPNIFY